ncbi:MAG: hypothetical protein L0312_29965 [Acidobacteria bacterium]|nr:hypothetical protein [Acidobacteriota bacterium]
MTIFGKSVSQYVHFLGPILGFILVVGVARLLLSLAGVSVASVRYFSLTAAWLVGLVVCSITVHTRSFGSYKQLLALVAIQSLVAQAFTAAVVALAIVTGHDNIYSIPEFSGNVDGKTWGHAGAHLAIAAPILTLAGWLIGSAILFVTKKVAPANTGGVAPKGKARAAGA